MPKPAVVQVLAGIGGVHQRTGEGQEEGPSVCALPQLQAHSPAQGWLVWQVSPSLDSLHQFQSPAATPLYALALASMPSCYPSLFISTSPHPQL